MLRYYLDDDSSRSAVVAGLRQQGFIVVVPDAVGLRGASDEQHLTYASAQGLALVTANAGDFLQLHTAWLRGGQDHAGIVIAAQQRFSVGETIRRLARLGEHREPHELVNTVEFLSHWGGE